jgi:hypothetical protein
MRRRLDSAGVAGYSFFDGVDCRSEPPCAAYLDGLHDFVGLQTNASFQVADGWWTFESCSATVCFGGEIYLGPKIFVALPLITSCPALLYSCFRHA